VVLKICGQHLVEELALHKCVLLSSSDFFKAMFTTNFKESTQQAVTVRVAEGSSVAATVLVLRYLYTSEITIGADNVMEVLVASDKLQLPKLRSACVKFLEQSVNAANVCTILTASKHLNLAPLLEACTKFILRNGKDVLEGEGFKTLSKEAVISIISDPDLHATEEEVFEGVMLWGKAVVARGGAVGDDVSDAVSNVIPHLRLDEMEHAFLYNRVKESGVFSADMLLEASMKMLDKHTPSNERVFDSNSESGAEEGSTQPAAKKLRIGYMFFG
jgi:hypothetical protein